MDSGAGDIFGIEKCRFTGYSVIIAKYSFDIDRKYRIKIG